MIQRPQTLWLLLSAISALLSFMFPFVTGKGIVKGLEADISVSANGSVLLLLATGISLVLSGATIFLYKNRPLQMMLSLVGLFLGVGIIILYIMEMNKLDKATLALFAILPFAMLTGYFMAYRNIRKDEKLVKSLDKLR
jgi:hypothetical protein